MTCKHAKGWMTDALTGQISPEDAKLFETHLTSCPACRKEMQTLRQTWEGLEGLHSPSPPDGALERLLTEVRRKPTRVRIVPIGVQRAAAAVALLFLGSIIGWTSRGLEAGSSGTVTAHDPHDVQAPLNRYLLILRQPDGFTDKPEGQLVTEYQAWGNDLAQQGKLEAGEKLMDSGIWMKQASASETPPDDRGDVAGYFIVRADSYEEAIRLAHPSPHLRYGGVIEMREIDPLDDGP